MCFDGTIGERSLLDKFELHRHRIEYWYKVENVKKKLKLCVLTRKMATQARPMLSKEMAP